MGGLMKQYKNGYNDEKFGTSSVESDSIREQLAYGLGAKHAIDGTDPSLMEGLTDERIMEEIEKKKKKKGIR